MTPETTKEIWNEAISKCQEKVIGGYFLWNNRTTVSYDLTPAKAFIIAESFEELKLK